MADMLEKTESQNKESNERHEQVVERVEALSKQGEDNARRIEVVEESLLRLSSGGALALSRPSRLEIKDAGFGPRIARRLAVYCCEACRRRARGSLLSSGFVKNLAITKHLLLSNSNRKQGEPSKLSSRHHFRRIRRVGDNT